MYFEQCSFEMFAFIEYRDLETQVTSQSRSWQMTQFDKSYMTSY